MAVLAIVSVALLGVDGQWARIVEWSVYGVFVVDYVTRLVRASDRRRFVKRNIPDLIAIVPFGAFRLARVARLARLARAGSLVWRTTANARAILMTNGLGWVLAAAVGTVVLGAVGVWLGDPSFTSFGDALWWSIVTTTTVGYGDLSPTHLVGRVVAVVEMLVGIGTIGMLTGSIATYFVNRGRSVATQSAEATVTLDGRSIRLSQQEADHIRVTLSGLGLL